MAWKAFDKGVACFKSGQLDEALAHMNQAAELEKNVFVIYDSRAAVHEKLGNIKDALADSKRVIDLAPGRWQGYARSARLFDHLGEYASVVRMVDHALICLLPEDGQRHAQLIELRERAVAAQAAVQTQRLSLVTQTIYLLEKLPVETLVEIFRLLIDEDHTWAVKLSHVCGHWRQILINAPTAWQTLVLSDEYPVQKAMLWVQRAENRISRLSIFVSQLDRAAIFAQLRNLSWNDVSTLCISSDAFVELHCMLSDISLSHAFSNLDELRLLDFKSPEQLTCCLSGPDWKLRILRLEGVMNLKKEWWQRIRRLKELHLTGFVGPLSAHLFANNPLLERLVLQGSTIFLPNTDDDAPPTSMENLRSIKFNNIFHPLHVLRNILAPSLTHFSLVTAGYMVDEALLHIASSASLVELCVGNCDLGLHTLPALLSSTPNLETLRINTIEGVVNEVLRFLTPKVVDSLPCRALQHVDVSECSDLTILNLRAFVKTRIRYAYEFVELEKRCAIIASLKVDGCPNIKRKVLPWFRSKVDQFSCVSDATENGIKYKIVVI